MDFKKDEIISITRYCRVDSNEDGTVNVTDLDSGLEFSIKGKSLQSQCVSSDKHAEIVIVTRTELASIFVGCKGVPFTVVFKKAKGDLRTLRGRLISSEGYLGRSFVEDLDNPIGDRSRQVDHRTLESLIVNNIRYEVK